MSFMRSVKRWTVTPSSKISNSGYLRKLAGWVDTVIDLNNPGNYTAEHDRYDTVMKFSTDKANEYFIVENRNKRYQSAVIGIDFR